MKRFDTFTEMFLNLEKSQNNPVALNSRVKGGGWNSMSTDQMLHEIKCISLGLVELGVKPGECVGFLAMPSPRWTVADLSTLLMRIVNVPMFPNASEKNFLYEVDLTEQKVIFVSGKEPWQMIQKHREKFDVVIAMDTPPEDAEAVTWEHLLERGNNVLQKTPNKFYNLIKKVKPEDIATVIFTSGTTGVPKGAVHTHKSLGANTTFNSYKWQPGKDSYLSILPLAHIFGRVLNYVIVNHGVSVYYLNDILAFKKACQKLKPTILIIVPRLLEKMYAGIGNKIKQGTGLKRSLGEAAFSLAQEENPPFYKRLLKPFFDKLVYAKFRAVLGGNVRLVVSGGAPLDPKLTHFFNNVGIPTYEGWGMTESNIGAANYKGMQKIGSVGTGVFPDVEFKITEDGEILFRCMSQMKEYYKNPEITAETIDSEGWLHTGDKGTIDADGYLTIERRIKELYKTSVGEYVAPLPIEAKLREHPLVDMAMVIGETRKFASCLLFPDFEAVEAFKKKHGMESSPNEEFLRDELVRQEIMLHIDEMNEHLNEWERIRAFDFVPHAPSIQTGEMTPTMKLRRNTVIEKYIDLIDAMYTP